MVQVGKYQWQLETKDGKVLKEALLMHSVKDAEAWAKSYISSFQSWSLEIKPKENK